MMYCTVNEVLSKIKDGVIDVILEEEGPIEDKETREKLITPYCEEAISDACAEIDGRVSKRYSVPFDPVPQIINKLAKDIAVYNLVSRTGIDEDDRENTIYIRYKNAIAFLQDVAKGNANIGSDPGIGGNTGTGVAASDGFRYQSNDRLFSRDSMKGY